MPASDTGAVEMAMWSLLGPKPVTVVHFESFGGEWYTDITKQLKLEKVTNCQADYGVLPPLESVNWKTDDVVFNCGVVGGPREGVDRAGRSYNRSGARGAAVESGDFGGSMRSSLDTIPDVFTCGSRSER